MKAKELMIGDYVYNHRNWECPIVEIHKNSAVVIARHYGEEEFLVSDLRPIPLTAEILEKNGFKKGTYSILDKGGYKSFPEYKYINREEITNTSKNLIKVSYSDKNGGVYDISFGISSHIFDIKYVHELQHALRLCGIDKEIVL